MMASWPGNISLARRIATKGVVAVIAVSFPIALLAFSKIAKAANDRSSRLACFVTCMSAVLALVVLARETRVVWNLDIYGGGTHELRAYAVSFGIPFEHLNDWISSLRTRLNHERILLALVSIVSINSCLWYSQWFRTIGRAKEVT
jgi:hypothetical protein